MKDSGIEWIGEIPETWTCCKQKHAIELINGRAYKDDEFLPEAKYRVLRVGNLFTNSTWYYSDMELEADKYCEYGDLIYAWSASYGPYIWNGEKVIYHYHIWKTVLSNTIQKKFAYYYLLALGESISSESHGSAMQHITMERMNNSYIAYPPLKEQHRIADFLDRKCAEIDAVIEKTKATIEEYKKLKQSVITEAVTKGIRGNRPMKDSGYDFIGTIPSEWEVCRLRSIGVPQNGISKGGEYFGQGFPFVSYGDVYKNFALPTSMAGLVESTEDERERYSVQYGDIFFTRTSETIEEVGFSSVCLQTIPDATFAGFLIRVRPFTDKLFAEYSKYYFRSSHHRAYLTKQMNLVTRASLGQDLLKSMPVLLPSIEEQKEIAAYLDEKCAALDTLIAKKTALLAELETYKKSLVYEYVTGKKEVE